MRKTLLLLLLPLQLFSQSSTIIAHAAAINNAAGSVTTSAIDTTGANSITLEGMGVFGVGAISDSKGNTWTAAQVHTTIHNIAMETFFCSPPCTVGAGHTFTQASNGSGFGEQVAAQAWSGGRLVGGAWADVNVLSSPAKILVTAETDSVPPFTLATASVENTTAGVIALAICGTEQGTGGLASIDSGFTVLDHVAALTTAWKWIPAASTTFTPTWTAPSDALHIGVQLVGVVGTVGSSYVPNFVITLGP